MKKHISIRISSELYNQFFNYTKQALINPSALIRKLLEDYLSQVEKEGYKSSN